MKTAQIVFLRTNHFLHENWDTFWTYFTKLILILVMLLSNELQLYWLPFQSWKLLTSKLTELPWKQALQFMCWKETQGTVYTVTGHLKRAGCEPQHSLRPEHRTASSGTHRLRGVLKTSMV